MEIRWQLVGGGQGGEREEGLSKKGKGLMDMDNSVGIAGGKGHMGTKW